LSIRFLDVDEIVHEEKTLESTQVIVKIMNRILAINGSYRDDGITDQTVEAVVQCVQAGGAEAEIVLLRDYPIEFCLNCRECTQQPGESPGLCVQRDAMHDLVNRIELADAFILAAPTNFGSVTAVFKRFMERLVMYAYWPRDMNAPRYRKANAARKKAVLIASCAAPGVLGRWLHSTTRQLRMTANIIGADTVGTLFTGLVSKQQPPYLSKRTHAKARSLASKLL
jgi:multimeric flavodoxin WrbA